MVTAFSTGIPNYIYGKKIKNSLKVNFTQSFDCSAQKTPTKRRMENFEFWIFATRGGILVKKFQKNVHRTNVAQIDHEMEQFPTWN